MKKQKATFSYFEYLSGKNDLQNLFSGKGEVRFEATIQAVTHHFEKSSSSSPKAKGAELVKKQEADKLEVFITKNDLWKKVDFTKYLSEGAE